MSTEQHKIDALKHKIDARNKTVFEVLNERKFTVDYFQREYSWEKKHIEQLITDLTSAFLDAYRDGDSRMDVKNYNNYFLGPFVISSKGSNESIIDGQQRLTSLTLFLIFLNNLQKEIGWSEKIEDLIFSEEYDEKSFNINVEERIQCLDKLFHEGRYEPQPDDDESTVNMAARYVDIENAFPEEIKGKIFPYFIDWLKRHVIFVEITAYSDDNAYAIFESMNDRGLNLTSTEMLKGFVLSRFQEANDRDRINTFWKKAVQDLHIYDKDEDQQFFQAWLRSQYAVTIRQSKAGAANEDFEKIGAGFHSWVRENLENMGLSADQPSGFQSLVHTEMKYYLKYYREILDARKKEKPGLEHVYYIEQWGIANSLSMPLMLAPLQSSDSEEIARKKINAVARYIEIFSVRRSINYRKFGASSIRYTMFTLVKELRRLNLDQLNEKLRSRLNEMEETWDGMAQFGLHGQNRNFVKFLLSRITAFIEQSAKHPTYFSTYHARQGSNQFEVEHIWADKFTEHQDEFEQQHEFEAYRNRIGDLVLLPGGTNQSYGAKPYSEKLEHYVKENLLVKSLHNLAYENNPNFTKMIQGLDLPFKAHDSFSKADIDERQLLYQRICEVIWNEDDFLEKADAAE